MPVGRGRSGVVGPRDARIRRLGTGEPTAGGAGKSVKWRPRVRTSRDGSARASARREILAVGMQRAISLGRTETDPAMALMISDGATVEICARHCPAVAKAFPQAAWCFFLLPSAHAEVSLRVWSGVPLRAAQVVQASWRRAGLVVGR